MIPDHIVMLVVALVVAWVLLRWGTLILLGYALYYFWTEQWGFAALALVYLLFFSAVKAIVAGLSRLTDEHAEERI